MVLTESQDLLVKALGWVCSTLGGEDSHVRHYRLSTPRTGPGPRKRVPPRRPPWCGLRDRRTAQCMGLGGRRNVVDPMDVDGVMQQVRLELYRDNLQGALEVLEAAGTIHPDPRYTDQTSRIRSWLSHLRTPEAYSAAYERYYQGVKRRVGLKRFEWELRVILGRKTRKMVNRCSRHPEFELLEREVLALGARRVLDAGCGEGRVALTLAARHPHLRVEGIEVSRTNVRIAQRLNRFPNVAFHEGLIEEADHLFGLGSFNLAYSFAVLEHVPDVEVTVSAILKLLQPGGRCCFVVPMVELKAVGPIPDFEPPDGVAGHVRVFRDAELRKRFGGYPKFALVKIPGQWRPGRYPDCLGPEEFGSFFVALSKP